MPNLDNVEKFLRPPVTAKALIFDLDGTLADTMPLHLQSWRQLGQIVGVPIKDKMITDLAGTPTPEVALELNKKFGWSLDPVGVQRLKNETYAQLKLHAGPVEPIQHVYALAEAYRGHLPMSIGTGSTRANADAAIRDMNMADWFVTVVTAEDVTAGKPDPETFLKCAAAMNVAPAECILYEDGHSGIRAGLAAGMTVIHVETQEIFEP
ncbi:MAG: HAD-IA family hydrolase [Bacteroidota bacterium]